MVNEGSESVYCDVSVWLQCTERCGLCKVQDGIYPDATSHCQLIIKDTVGKK